MKANATPTAEIFATGIHLPEQSVTSSELMDEIKSEHFYGIPKTHLDSEMGIYERRVVPQGTKPSEIATLAAENAISSNSNVDPDRIGAVIFCGIERDNPEPATAHTIQSNLGLRANYVFDIANACYGFVDALHIAANYITTGIVEQALVVTGEVSSRIMYEAVSQLSKGVSQKELMLKIGALTVGDAAGAMVVGRGFGYERAGFRIFNNSVDSTHHTKCVYGVMPNGTIDGRMEMGKMVAANLRMQKNILGETLSKAGWDHFDWLLTHQIGSRYFDRLSILTNTPQEKMIKTYPTLGNITTATLPVSYHKLIKSGNVRSGDRVGGCFAGSGLVAGQFGYRV